MSHSPVRAAAKGAAFLGVIAVLLPFYLAAFGLGAQARRLFAYPFYRACVGLTGIRLHAGGAPINAGATLYVANHVSYLDIPLLATLADGVFVAKADVKSWPLFGFLAKIGRTIFVSRQASRIRRERLEIVAGLARGEKVFLFPEGSSSDGSTVLPFRGGLLSAVQLDRELAIPIQPLSIVYGPAAADRPAADAATRDRYAWYGDMDMAPHLWWLFGSNQKMAVTVLFHPPRLSTEFADRHALLDWAESAVAQGLEQGLNGVGETQDVLAARSEPQTASTPDASRSPPVLAAP